MKIRFSKVQFISSLSLTLLPLYFLITFSAVICQFHHSGETAHTLFATSAHAKHHHSAGDKGNLCKFFHDISQVALINPVLNINPVQDPVNFQFNSKNPVFLGNHSTQYLRGPPASV